MLRHDLLVADALRERYLALRDPPFAACTRHTLKIVVAGFLKNQVIHVLPVSAKEFALVGPLPKMCTLEVCDSMRSPARLVKSYPLRCKIMVCPDRP